MNIDWFVGFLEGEGCFAIHIKRSYYHKIGWMLQPSFKINITEGKNVLIKLKNFLKSIDINSNKIREVKEESWGKRAKSQSLLQITDMPSLHKLINIITPLMQTKKREEAIIFKEILIKIEGKNHLNKQGFIETMELVDKLRNLRTSRSKIKYTKEYFSKIFQ